MNKLTIRIIVESGQDIRTTPERLEHTQKWVEKMELKIVKIIKEEDTEGVDYDKQPPLEPTRNYYF